MADPRASIFQSVASRQLRPAVPRPGAVYLRGGEPVIIQSATNTRVQWRSAGGQQVDAPLQELFKLALDEVNTRGPGSTFLENVWQLAVSTGTPSGVRAAVVTRAAGRAATDVERKTVLRWAHDLSLGQEPRR